MREQQRHSELPWSVNNSGAYGNGHGFIVWGKDGPGFGAVCRTFREGLIPSDTEAERCEANAAFIVTACNSFQQMRDAIRFALTTPGMIKGRDQLVAALQAAEGETR
jgi:hypothetical protein